MKKSVCETFARNFSLLPVVVSPMRRNIATLKKSYHIVFLIYASIIRFNDGPLQYGEIGSSEISMCSSH
jgi:hypothetical protein